jgi:hypothetical protein
VLWIALAVVFLCVLFLLKTNSIFENSISAANKQKNGLTYDNTETLGDLVNKSTSGDGIPDWEKRLYGLDPTKKENVPGVPDSVTIAKLEGSAAEVAGEASPVGNGLNGAVNIGTGTTKTDQFSQDLFATVAAASQNGQIDPATEDQISSSLADNIQNSPPRKTYLLTDIKIAKDDSNEAVLKYGNALNSIYKNYQVNYTVLDVLQQFSADANNVDTSVLVKLDPIIKQTQSIIDGMTKINVPQSLAVLHLNVLNDFEKIAENLNDIKLYDTDTVVALGGITKYQTNAPTLTSDVTNLTNAIIQKLKPQ